MKLDDHKNSFIAETFATNNKNNKKKIKKVNKKKA